MKPLRLLPAAALGVITLLTVAPALTAQQAPAAADWLSPAYPYEVQSARKAERIAFLAYDEGKRNVFTKKISKFPAMLGKPGIIRSLMKKIIARLVINVTTTPHAVGVYFLK